MFHIDKKYPSFNDLLNEATAYANENNMKVITHRSTKATNGSVTKQVTCNRFGLPRKSRATGIRIPK